MTDVRCTVGIYFFDPHERFFAPLTEKGLLLGVCLREFDRGLPKNAANMDWRKNDRR